MKILINYYAILGIPKAASSIEVKKAYRKLALEWHPDKNKSANAHSKFLEIKEAYEILIDDSKRKIYDDLIKSNIIKTEKASDVFTTNESSSKYDDYIYWKKQASQEAVKQASMKFNDFARSLGIVIKETTNTISTLIGILIFCSWGPYLLYFLISDFISRPDHYAKLPILNLVGLFIMFLVGLGITGVLLIAGRNWLRNEFQN